MKVVKSMPFSAEVYTESTQVLVDGNRIVRKNTAFIARDSEGRTLRKQSLSEDATIAFIQDPVAGVSYSLESQLRSARKFTFPRPENTKLPAESNTIVDRLPQVDRVNIRNESLGTEIIDGLRVEGTRIIRTIPVGQAGNDRVLEIVSEAWYSTELQIIVMNRSTDPRSGETVYKVTNIQRGEPERSLFEVPEKYTVHEEPQAIEFQGGKAKNR